MSGGRPETFPIGSRRSYPPRARRRPARSPRISDIPGLSARWHARCSHRGHATYRLVVPRPRARRPAAGMHAQPTSLRHARRPRRGARLRAARSRRTPSRGRVEGNRAQVLLNGDEIFPAMLAAIRRARTTITFANFIYEDGDIAAPDGRRRWPTGAAPGWASTCCSTRSARAACRGQHWASAPGRGMPGGLVPLAQPASRSSASITATTAASS